MHTTIDLIDRDKKTKDLVVDLAEKNVDGQASSCEKSLPECLEFWESERTRPNFKPVTKTDFFSNFGQEYLENYMKHCYLDKLKINQIKFERICQLVDLAYHHIPVYQEKYKKAGFNPSHLNCLEDIEKIPIITKQELIAAFPQNCLNHQFKPQDLYPTRSSGSSGETLLIRVNEQAIFKDTIHGIRQFALQSGLKYCSDDLLAHVYTVPWWFNNVADKYYMAFISNVIPPNKVADYLQKLAPQIISLYPSNLEALLPYSDYFNENLYLVVTHSEYSSKFARTIWSKKLGCPVLDEYSSEEATRIALELPCGHYHVCEDAVHLEVLDPQTNKSQRDGVSGIAVITNLLNEAMPFIRYVQSDFITRPLNPKQCHINWSQLECIDGRLNDSFINNEGRKIPSGSLLDITYRWMFDKNLDLEQFELVQKKTDVIEANFVLNSKTKETSVKEAIMHLENLLSLCLEHHTIVIANIVSSFTATSGKRRPIRCEVKTT
jgi:phenylacetate-CoA ligase